MIHSGATVTHANGNIQPIVLLCGTYKALSLSCCCYLFSESKSESEPRTVTISPGVTTGELMAFFLKYNICFESDVLLPTVTYGGIFSGGCHVRASRM